jgi:peptide/nickel transport system permease protein
MTSAEIERDAPAELQAEGRKTPGGVISLQTMGRSLGHGGLLGLLPMILWVLVAILAPLLTEYSPIRSNWEHALQPPSAEHWFGTNNTGADVFARVIYGARLDLFIGFVSVGAAFLFAVPIGAMAGYFRSWWSGLVMRVMDFLQSFPIFVLAMAFVAVLGPRISNVIIILGVLNVPIFVRLTRAEVLVLREATFIEAARCVGNTNLRLILFHVLPNALGPALAQVSINIGWALLLTAGLSFVGAGLQPPAPEWGLQISEGADNIVSGQWWISLFPGLALGLCVLSFALAGDVIRKLLDVRGR